MEEKRDGSILLGLSWCLQMIVQHVLDTETLQRVETIRSGIITF